MNRKLLLCLAPVIVCLTAGARAVRPWTTDELQKASDLVVIARPIAVKDLQETNSLGWGSTPAFQSRFRGVETTFKVSNVIKGMPATDQIVLHHYRGEEKWGSPPNGPMLATFDPDVTNDYVLYLVKEGSDRYVPALGQMDSSLSVTQPPAATNHIPGFPMFPVLPPKADADPRIRHAMSIRVPVQLKTELMTNLLSVAIDTNSMIPTDFLVGTNMVTGVDVEVSAWPTGLAQPGFMPSDNSELSGVDALGDWVWHKQIPGSLPGLSRKYDVVVNVTIFETAVPPQHMWNPYGKNYKIFWHRTLTQTVE